MRRTARCFIAAGALFALSGCAANLSFNSPSALGFGVQGMTWQIPYSVDTALFTPSALPTQHLDLDFDAVAYGSSLQLAGTWLDASTTSTYRGYARLYQDGVGWSALGPGFGQIASDSGNSLSFASVGAGPNGLFMANFFGTANGASASYTGALWQRASNNAGLAHLPKTGYYISSAMDSLGRGFVFFQDSATLQVFESQWATADPNGLGTSFNPISPGATQTNSPITARFDGVSQVCGTYETNTSILQSNCQNVACGGTFGFGNAAVTIGTGVFGHDTATDGAGQIMAVFNKGSGSTYNLYASIGTISGTCSTTPTEAWSTPVQIDAGMTSGFKGTYPGLWPNGSRPGVAYVGGGKFLAVWIAVNPTTSPPTTKLYSSLYDPAAGGWQKAATEIGGTLDNYNLVPHPQMLTVFGYPNGNAGYALNKIITSDKIPGAANQAGSIFPEAAQARVTELHRWQQDDQWVPGGPITFTNTTCFMTLTGLQASGGTDAGCTHRPVGAILPSGNSLVFFQSQDNYSGGVTTLPAGSSSPGNLRISVSEFK